MYICMYMCIRIYVYVRNTCVAEQTETYLCIDECECVCVIYIKNYNNPDVTIRTWIHPN